MMQKEIKMKVRSGKLIDRWINHAGAWVTLQTPRGGIVHVRVLDEHIADAKRIWGGTPVHYVYRGGRPFYDPSF